jgi:hypothetical protein
MIFIDAYLTRLLAILLRYIAGIGSIPLYNPHSLKNVAVVTKAVKFNNILSIIP